AVVISGPTFSGDEVYVSTKGKRIVGMSKDADKFNACKAGELVGITKVSRLLFKEMIAEAEIQFSRTLQVDYETDCLSAVSVRFPLYHCLVSDLIWSEIDTPSDMQHTHETVYPAIIKQAQRIENFDISQPHQRPVQPGSDGTFESGNDNNL
ncbi:MAG: hypothetical protein V3U16_06820, partial [Candidatus Neomarinimicrobiota bacterium]